MASFPPSYESKVGVFWDYENCEPPSGVPGYAVGDKIREIALQFGDMAVFKAYLHLPQTLSPKTMALHSELQSSGVSLTNCLQLVKGKDVIGKMISADILAFAIDNPPPAVIILISDDRDFINTHPTLRAQAGTVFEWSDLFSDSYPLTPEGQENHEEDEDFLAPSRETAEARAQYTPEPVPPTIKPATPKPQPAPASTSTSSAGGSSKAAPSPGNPPKPKTQKAKPPVPEAFRDLVSMLEAARLKGVARLSTTAIGQNLQSRKTSYQQAGVTKFVPWLQKAEAQGVVQLISLTKEGTGWVALREAYI